MYRSVPVIIESRNGLKSKTVIRTERIDKDFHIYDMDFPECMSLTNAVSDEFIEDVLENFGYKAGDFSRIILHHPDNTVTEWVDGGFKFIEKV